MTDKYMVVFNTCPDRTTADALAQALVELNLAACVSILPGARSVYRWQGKIETAEEQLLMIKTRTDRYAEVERELKARHPYQVPEIIALPVTQGLAPYLSWIDDNVGK
ncbi:MAG: divalent-cation tolerance protein CutA [Pseudomonadota bacterium]